MAADSSGGSMAVNPRWRKSFALLTTFCFPRRQLLLFVLPRGGADAALLRLVGDLRWRVAGTDRAIRTTENMLAGAG